MPETAEQIRNLSVPEWAQRSRMCRLEGFDELGDLYDAIRDRDYAGRLALAEKIVVLNGK